MQKIAYSHAECCQPVHMYDVCRRRMQEELKRSFSSALIACIMAKYLSAEYNHMYACRPNTVPRCMQAELHHECKPRRPKKGLLLDIGD
jgi:hypothetical protein